MPIKNRYDFVYYFDVVEGNPNGDPDAGNMPRTDPQTGRGLVTDVCLKRKVRDYVDLMREEGRVAPEGNAIYVAHGALLNDAHELAYASVGVAPSGRKTRKDDDTMRALKAYMCRNYYDVRAFGAVMSTEVDCGQVRGPVQMTFAESVDPVVPTEVSVARVAITNRRDSDKQTTFGSKQLVQYGLYRAHGFVSAPLADKTGFDEDDLGLLFDALANMFEHDRSASRGLMSSRALVAFRHATRLGTAHAADLFATVTAERVSEGPARCFSDYRILVDAGAVPDGVEVLRLV